VALHRPREQDHYAPTACGVRYCVIRRIARPGSKRTRLVDVRGSVRENARSVRSKTARNRRSIGSAVQAGEELQKSGNKCPISDPGQPTNPPFLPLRATQGHARFLVFWPVVSSQSVGSHSPFGK